MKTQALALALAGALLAASPAFAAPTIVVGFDQGWIDGKYAHDLSDQFDENDWRRVLERTKDGGGTVLRVWLFEGKPLEGVVWDGHTPRGVDPVFLANVGRLADLALAAGVRIYWTATDGNWPAHWAHDVDFERLYNIYANKFGQGDAFRANVLGPVLDVIAARPGCTYAFDMLNEVEGSTAVWLWSDGWDGARRYLSDTARFVHGRATALRVTASAGWDPAADDILAGRFDGLGLDFLDCHVYTDDTTVPRGADLVRHADAQRIPIIVGELGQKSAGTDPVLQSAIVRGVLRDAERQGFEAVFPWRLEDAQVGTARFSFYDGNTPRPALALVASFVRDDVPDPSIDIGDYLALPGRVPSALLSPSPLSAGAVDALIAGIGSRPLAPGPYTPGDLATAIAGGLALDALRQGLDARPLGVSAKLTPGPVYEERELTLTDPYVGTVHAILLVPNGPGPFPAVLALHGHGDSAAIYRDEFHGRDYPGRGYAILMLTGRGMNIDRFEHKAARALLANGLTLMGARVYEALLGLKYLRSLPEIDAGRLGLIGHSGGSSTGNLVVRLAPDLKAYVSDLTVDYRSSGDELDHCETVPGLFPFHELIGDFGTCATPVKSVPYGYAHVRWWADDEAEASDILDFFDQQLQP